MSAFFANMITAVVEVFASKAPSSPRLEISDPVLQPRRDPKDSGETSFEVSDDDGSLSLSSD